MQYQTIIDFWFSDATRSNWWSKDSGFDQMIRDRFETIYQSAVSGELAEWRETALGRLAEIIVLDQFPRNMYRDQAAAFANDHLARQLTHDAVAAGADEELATEQRSFLYMPLMHSESPSDHEIAVELYASDSGLADNLKFEHLHKGIIDRFGRYPHRNEILGRISTPAELEFLNQPGSSF